MWRGGKCSSGAMSTTPRRTRSYIDIHEHERLQINQQNITREWIAMAVAHAGLKRSFELMSGQVEGRNSRLRQSSLYSHSSTSQSSPSSAARSEYANEPKLELLRKAYFPQNASIVLVGVRGVGKSSLGVLAATAYNRRLVDFEREFFEATGTSQAEFRRLHGPVKFHAHHYDILKRTFATYEAGCVIICGFVDIEGRSGGLLRTYCQQHPVIQIWRESSAIRHLFRAWPEERIHDFLITSQPLLKACSNFDFFNLSEHLGRRSSVAPQTTTNIHATEFAADSNAYLKLKRVERDFLRFLRNIIGDEGRGNSHHSAYPLSKLAVELREHTYALAIDAKSVTSEAIDLEHAQIGADCIELILDQPGDLHASTRTAAQAFAVIRRSSILPIMLTLDPDCPLDRAFPLTEYLLRLGPEYCTVNLEFSDTQINTLIEQRGGTTMVGHLHFMEGAKDWENEELGWQYDRAVNLGCSIVRLTKVASRQECNSTFLAACKAITTTLDKPLIAYETGPGGRTSKCFNKILTSVTRQNCWDDEPSKAGEVTAKELTKALYASFVLDPMKFKIYGSDVSYSISPAMHNAAYQACGVPHTFELHSSSDLTQVMKSMRSNEFGGGAITMPFKTAIIAELDGVSHHARAIGAVNTVIPVRSLDDSGKIPTEIELINQRNKRGQVKALYGYNTDWIGIRACIRKSLSPANAIRKQSSALVCGAGGMARAAIYALISLGVRNILVCNRTIDRAIAVVETFNQMVQEGGIQDSNDEDIALTRIQVLESHKSEWPAGIRQPTVIISCVPTQTSEGKYIDIVIPDKWTQSPTGGVALEVAYKRSDTPMKAQFADIASKGWIYMGGYEVMPEQAFGQFELFTGRRAPRNVMRKEAMNAINIDNEKD